MQNKNFLSSILIFALIFTATIFSSTAVLSAQEETTNAGVLTYLGTTEAEFQEGLDDLRKAVAPLLPENEGSWLGEDAGDMLESFMLSLVKTRRVIHFYDSLLEMQMALKADRVDEIALPESVGLHLIKNNPDYEILFSLNMMPSTISFGFKQDNKALQQEFNKALLSMKKDGTLKKLAEKYIYESNSEGLEHVKFDEFKGAPIITAAVTGDLPPIDFIGADGTPAGYNTAILSEIGRRLHKNISLVSVNAGSRSAALVSGRVDVVFWYRNTEGIKAPAKTNGKNLKDVMKDLSQEIILSEPYFEWDVDLIISKAR